MKYLIVEERVVVTEHIVSEITANDRSTAFAMFDAFCQDNQPCHKTSQRIMYEIGERGERKHVASR